MILYREHYGGLNLFLRVSGAPWPRALFFALPSTVAAVLLTQFAPDFMAEVFLHPGAYVAFATLVTFGLVFRTNLSYARYWEGCSTVHNMTGKWADAAIQVIACAEAAEDGDADLTGGLRFRTEFVHAMSLMYALALQALRGDNDLTNITFADFWKVPDAPPVDAMAYQRWSAVRPKRSIFALQQNEEHYCEYWRSCPLPVLGGLSPSETKMIRESKDRVYLVFCWVTRMITARRSAGGIQGEAPIIARIFQALSDGMLGYETRYKIMSTPFPFPFAQAVSLLLHMNAILAPLGLGHWAGPPWLAGVVTFFTVFSGFLFDEVAREIEEPFRYEPNDLPVVYYQHRFNEHLVTAFVKSTFPSNEGMFGSIPMEESLEHMRASHSGRITSSSTPRKARTNERV